MTRKILSFVGISAMLTLLALNVSHALDGYGLMTCSLSRLVFAQSSSSSDDGGGSGGTSEGDTSEGDTSNDKSDEDKVWDCQKMPNSVCYILFADSDQLVKGSKTICTNGKKYVICPDCIL